MRAKGNLLTLFLIFPSHSLVSGIVKQYLRSGYDLYWFELSLTFQTAQLRRGIRFILGCSRVIGQLLRDKQAVRTAHAYVRILSLVTGGS